MREFESLVELGIMKLEEHPKKNDSTDISYDKLCAIQYCLTQLFPEHNIRYCDSIFKDLYQGWTIGITGLGCEKRILNLSQKFPNVHFILKSADNYGVFLYSVVNGTIQEEPERCVLF